ncbi:TPA: glycosyltransferase [Raoultella planticola]
MTESKSIILNLTTTSGRLDLCSATLWSLVNQSLLPGRINLWISAEPYMADEGIQILPDSINRLIKYNDIIKVHYVENTGPYRKIIPALRSCLDEDILVYADDDVVYSHHWLEYLISFYLENNREYVVSSRLREMKKNFFGLYQSYSLFPLVFEKKVFYTDFIITGVGGCVLERKHISQKYIDLNSFKKIAPKTDDLWISKIIELSGSGVIACPKALDCIMEIQHDIHALNRMNTFFSSQNIISKMIGAFKRRLLGYCGVSLSNNDVMIKKINSFFKRNI